MSANVNRKAYFFSGASGLVLVSFAVLYQLGLSPFETWGSYLILGVLLAATAVPLITRKWCENMALESALADFADLIPPPAKSFDFAVPALPTLKRIQLAPARIASALAGLMILLMFGGGNIVASMMDNNVPFAVFIVLASLFVLLVLALIVLFVAATRKDLYQRQSFHDEVLEGLAAAGYTPIREFNAEVVDDRRLLLTDGKDHYSWWDISFHEDRATVEWADTRNGEGIKIVTNDTSDKLTA